MLGIRKNDEIHLEKLFEEWKGFNNFYDHRPSEKNVNVECIVATWGTKRDGPSCGSVV